MTPIELLNKTESLIRNEGWGQGHHPGCLLTRMYQAAGLRFGHAVEKDHPVLREAAQAVRQYVKAQHLTLWNDAKERKYSEVLDAIEGARLLLAKTP